MRIEIKYDANDGQHFPDGKVREVANKIAKGDIQVECTSSGLLLDYLRLLRAKREIDELIFHYRDYALEVQPDGTLELWPEGFNDTFDTVLNELLTAQWSLRDKEALCQKL